MINNNENVKTSFTCSNKNAIADSGCTNHYICTSSPCTNISACKNGIQVKQPDGAIMTSSHTALLDFPTLPIAVRRAHIFPSMQNKALLSLGQFCDNGYDVALTRTTISINHHHNPSLSLYGQRDTTTGMWTVDISAKPHPPTITSHCHNIYELNKKRDIVTYLHKAAFSPVPSTWIQAIETGFYTSWPGLTPDLVKKHLPKSPATVKGHLRQIRQNLRSTKPKPLTPTPNNDTVMTTEPPLAPVRAKNLISFKIIELGGEGFQ